MKGDKDELRAMGHHADQTKSSLARGRWKLLRNALLLDPTVPVGTAAIDDDCHTSIHSFPGYQMLQSIWVDGNEPHGTEECHSLMRIIGGKAGYTREDLPRLNRVLQAIRWRAGLEISLKCDYRTMTDSSFLDLPLDWRAEPSEDGSSTTVYCIKKLDETTRAHDPDDPYPRHPQSTDFGIKAYRCANDCDNGVVIYIHERRRQRTTLRDLVRHRATGIDNTGSVCVWDAAQTLAWYLCTHLFDPMTMIGADQQQNELIVLELGAGMAALSGLMMLQQLSHWHQSKMKLFISDGQPECVENNKINCLLLEAELRSRVECVLLPWSLFVPTTMASIQATTTLIADCTHFEQYHGELLWTMLYHTAVGGTIYLCQPRRGQSWATFAALLETLNHNHVSAAAAPIVQVQQIALVELDTKRTEFESQSSTNGFRSDVHHPYIFSVKKLRTETENDKKTIIESLSMGMAK
jgi:Lysine methyltransferase